MEPFSKAVDDRFDGWLEEQEKLGRTFAPEQMEWLIMVKDHIASSVSISMEDFENVPFNQKGGAIKAYQLFGDGR
ncbi:MAG: type I restriction-modification enzyme R subunit C-terminal domain-containing protein [Euryarchaeota archaeon]|nr:type I restriction-modification enzyme R subunit C-terminal domain-containing protein [Euryarchaeota archaeon]